MTDLFSYRDDHPHHPSFRPVYVPTAFARTSDPQTSKDAATSVDEALPHLEQLVLGALKRVGDDGMTVDELVEELKIDKVTVSPRLRPLCDKGHVKAAEAKRAGISGRAQTVWVAV